ncbi:unnamed protein product [Ectocarpus fasciculatus]
MLQCGPARRNKAYIFEVLRDAIAAIHPVSTGRFHVLEVASGTGEHVAHFAEALPKVLFQPSDPDVERIASIQAWNKIFTNVLPPLHSGVEDLLSNGDVLARTILERDGSVDVIFCINMVHVSPFHCTVDLMKLCNKYLRPGGILLLYGPFRVNGYLTDSNVEFDQGLRRRNEEWGIRDLETVEFAAADEGIYLSKAVEMPANNLSLIFTKYTEQ